MSCDVGFDGREEYKFEQLTGLADNERLLSR